MFTAAISAAASPGPRNLSSGSTAKACALTPKPSTQIPMAGPIATPALVAAETHPSDLARSSGFVASATYAWTTPTVPPPAPCTRRQRSSSSSECAKAKTTYASTDAPSPIISAGRRPILSDTRPQKGALTSCATAKVVRSSDTATPTPPRPTASSAVQSGP